MIEAHTVKGHRRALHENLQPLVLIRKGQSTQYLKAIHQAHNEHFANANQDSGRF